MAFNHDETRLKLYLAHRAALIDYAAPIVGCRARAEDVVQEAYIRFVPARAAEIRIEQPVAYLYRIVRNVALDWSRRLSAETRRNDARSRAGVSALSTPSPEDVALYRDELRCVEAALAELPDRVRLAFEMHRLGGCTLQQIADRLDVSLATAGRWTQEALFHIARRLQIPAD
ncbi:MAG: sigma-70 family RNA polymerase sigma factor [Alphaproteobacteria bacterium]|nr:sigma-70 family RNA polymerase sigma factor [Alphaproteobacteria bacterium]